MSNRRARLCSGLSRFASARSWPIARRTLVLGCIVLMAAACGRARGAPTPLPPGTRVVQPTPDFSSSTQGNAATTQNAIPAADAVRNRIAQQQAQATPTPITAGDPPTSTPSVLETHPELAVFARPTALGIVVGGGVLYAAPGGGAVVNMQVGTTLTITGRSADGGWYAAYLADGTAGWAPASQVRVFGDAGGLEVVQDSLGPAAVATMIAEASRPQQPIVTPVAGQAATQEGGVAAPVDAPDTASAITGPSVTVVVEGANVRSGPSTEFPVVGGLYQNEQAALLARNGSGDWLQVQLPDSVGWIFAPLVETSVPISELAVAEPPPASDP